MAPIFVMLDGSLVNVNRIIAVKPRYSPAAGGMGIAGSYLNVDGEPEIAIRETPEEVQGLIQDAIGRADDPFYDDEWGY